MRLLSESGTDERYVDAVRRWLAYPKRHLIRHIGVFLLLFAMGVEVPVLIEKGFVHAAGSEADYRLKALFSTAQMAGLPLSLAGYYLLLGMRARCGLRMDRLMVTYYDALGREHPAVQEGEDGTGDHWVRSRVIRWLYRKGHGSKAKTGAECVTLARQWLKRMRRLSLLLFGFVFVHVVLFLGFLRLVQSDFSHLSTMMAWGGLAVGLGSGVFGGAMAWCAVDHYIEALMSLRHPRVGRLMVRYHDALRGEVRGGAG